MPDLFPQDRFKAGRALALAPASECSCPRRHARNSTAADLAFVDLTGITRRAAADKARADAAAKAKQKQFADDLKL